MPLLIDAAGLASRREAAAGPLAALADSLAAELEPLLAREPVIPEAKARLTRIGGWCPRDGGRLEFDPWSPRTHRCPLCGGVETRDEDHRMWIMWYQLWLAERAVHGALLFALRGDGRHAALARSLLERLANAYLHYPNRDNALGPTRLFFSTYLESIWLLQVCLALDLLELAQAADGRGDDVRDRLIVPARELIDSFDEGGSNRQVWNDAALLASARLLGDDRGVEEAVYGRSGVCSHLAHGLLDDGTWFEGENYHVFAHRGLWYGVTMAEAAGLALPSELVARFDDGFAAPFLSALPDFTLPARRDSQYAISLRQWRFAESCELGLVRRDDPRLLGALQALYGGDVPRGPTGRDRSAADVERNAPASALSRADLGWRSLLCARPALPPLVARAPRSVLLEAQGLAILRRGAGRVYASLDYGHSGGGHGHPDRLNVHLAEDGARWLDDPGTGSYVDRSLHWYRSTLAHNAPLVDGRSQARVHGVLLAWDEMDDAGWVSAGVSDTAPGVRIMRTIVALDDHLVDVMEWTADREIVLDLPIHLAGKSSGVRRWGAGRLEGGDGIEDGFEFLRSPERAELEREGQMTLHARHEAATMDARVHAPGGEWWRAEAPAPPGQGDARFHLVRMRGSAGRVVSTWCWRGLVASLDVSREAIDVVGHDGRRHRHRASAEGWRIETEGGGTRDCVTLGGLRVRDRSAWLADRPPRVDAHPRAARASDGAAATARRPFAVPTDPPADAWLRFDLGEADYRRSEQPWRDAGAPTAALRLAVAGDALVVDVAVRTPSSRFVPADATNPFDNESPDIDGDGIQLYLASDAQGADSRPIAGRTERVAGWMLIPDAENDCVRVRPIAGYAAGAPPTAGSSMRRGGWSVDARLPLASIAELAGGRAFRLGLIVNTTTPGRERRAGQLVLGGSASEWIYLRGDRHAAGRLVPFVLA